MTDPTTKADEQPSRVGCIVALVVLVGVIVGAVYLVRYLTYKPPRWPEQGAFDREVWVEAKFANARLRASMLKALLEEHLALGQDRPTVVDLLGEPDAHDEPHLIAYHLGNVDVDELGPLVGSVVWDRLWIRFESPEGGIVRIYVKPGDPRFEVP